MPSDAYYLLGSFTDMYSLFWLALGAALGGVFIHFARSRGSKREMFIFAVGLVVVALIYGGLAVAGAGAQWIAIEVGGVAIFWLLAAAGLRCAPLLLAVGWVAHVGWDVGLHLIIAPSFVAAWYPTSCISFDLLVAGYIVWRAGGARTSEEAA